MKVRKPITFAISLTMLYLFMLGGCDEVVETPEPKTDAISLQIHNINAIDCRNGCLIIREGMAPDIYYFMQNDDGTYTFTFSSLIGNHVDFVPFDWDNNYQVGTLDNNGVVTLISKKAFQTDASFVTMGDGYTMSDVPLHYQINENEIIYFSRDWDKIIKLNPVSGANTTIPMSFTSRYNSFAQTSDGGFSTVDIFPDLNPRFRYTKIHTNGSTSFSHTDPYFEPPFTESWGNEKFTAFLSDSGSDLFFLNLSPTGDWRAGDWNTRIIKVNENGITEVKRDFISSNVPLKNIRKILPFKDGYVIMFNALQSSFGFEPAQIVFLDKDFNQVGNTLSVGDPSGDWQNQMVVNGNTVFYGAGTLPLSFKAIRDGKVITRNLDDFIGSTKMTAELYRMTPTKTGGIAILAWVKPTANSRDLLFMEFDENLELVKK